MNKETLTAKKREKNAAAESFQEIETRNEWLPDFADQSDIVKKASPAGVAKGGYYGLPMLKRPLWRWEIALYFFFEGVSAGAFLLGSLAEILGKNEDRRLVRASRYISLAALLPCPPLLIADLGKPQKFHHMLRVWKPKSPMNFGAWTLLAFSFPVALLALKEFAGDFSETPEFIKKISGLIPSRITSAAGIPAALVMLGYPGVLLETTSTPVWSETNFLGALFAASSMSNAVAALSIAGSFNVEKSSNYGNKLKKIQKLTALVEVAALAAYLGSAKSAAAPILKGRFAKLFWAGAVGAGLIAPTVVRGLMTEKADCETSKSQSAKSTISRKGKILGSIFALAGGLALKWAITHAGRPSAEDPEAARRATRPRENAPGWQNQNCSIAKN